MIQYMSWFRGVRVTLNKILNLIKSNRLNMFSIIFLLFCVYAKGLARSAPDYIRPCDALTPECLKESIQKAIPEFVKGIPSLGIDETDPLTLDVDDLQPQPGLKLSLKNGKLTGIKTCIVDSASYAKNTLDAKVHCNLTARGKYKASGRILIVTLNGDGDAKIRANNVVLNIKVKFEDKERDGVVYRTIKDISVKHRFDERVTFVLTNLFNGNPELSKAVLAFINENWKELAKEFGGPVVNISVQAVAEVVKKFFEQVPKNELFPN